MIGSDNSLSPNKWQAIIRTNDGPFYWRIYASFGFSGLMTTIKPHIPTDQALRWLRREEPGQAIEMQVSMSYRMFYRKIS